MVLEGGRCEIHTAKRLTRNDVKSDIMCAASVITARLLDK